MRQVRSERLVAGGHVSLSPDEIGQQNDKNENKKGNSDSYGNKEALRITQAFLS